MLQFLSNKISALFFFTAIISIGCSKVETKKIPEKETLFKMLSADETGIDFINQLEFNQDFNIYTYRNFYNGGGVGMGDINNDGLVDIYFTSNMKGNHLKKVI